MDNSRAKKFNEEVSSWLTKQSMFYQLFNSGRLVGFSGAGLTYYFGILIKLAFLLLILGVIAFLYFGRQHHDTSYAKKQAEKIKKSLKADEVILSQLRGGIFAPVEIPSLKAYGAEGSFFESFKMTNMRMDLGNKIMFETDEFKTPSVNCSKMDLELKISADEENSGMYGPLFDTGSWFRFTNMNVRSFNCKWGYSRNSKGSIEDSQMALRRNEKGVEITLKGGTMTYSWLKKVEIDTMTLLLTPNEFAIKDATFRRGDSLFTLELAVEEFGATPTVRGRGDILNCDIKELLSKDFQPYLGGVVDSSYEFSGSPSALKGMDFTFRPLVRTTDTPVLDIIPTKPYVRFTYELPLIKALGAVDRSVNYRNLKFDNNTWEVETRNGEIYVRDVSLKNDLDQVKMEMQFSLRSPSQEYVIATMNSLKKEEYIRLLQRPWLEEAGLEMLERKKSIGGNTGAGSLEYDDYVELLQTEKHFYGAASITFHEKSFIGKEGLREEFPTGEGNYRYMEVPLSGHATRLSQALANDLYYWSHKNR